MEDITNKFILQSNIIHNNKYNYSKSSYIDAKTKICITCFSHGDFFMRPNNHLGGQGCKRCGIESRRQNVPKSLSEFVFDSKLIHGDKYNYSKVNYINTKTKVELICFIHGSFWMRPNSHLNSQGCPSCGRNRHKLVSEYLDKTKICTKCKIEKSTLDFYIDGGYYRGKCKECEKNIKSEYRKVPKNKDRIRKYHKIYKNNRRQHDPIFRLRMDIPTIIRRSIKKKFYKDSIWNYLPYTPTELKNHIESQFDSKMTWDNHGNYWHIDHIIPQAAFFYDSETHPDFIKCWALTNLRPLEAKNNMHKSSIYNGKRLSSKYL